MYNQWPEDTRIYVGHDYPPPGTDRPVSDVYIYLFICLYTLLIIILVPSHDNPGSTQKNEQDDQRKC
jgi:hypothetical protein